jgi:hydroxymethylglutaryl-CoA synthase
MLDEFDAILMHSPYCKLVRKAFARLLFNEFNVLAKPSSDERLRSQERYKGFFEQVPEEYLSGSYDNWMKPIDKTSLEKVAIQLSEQLYQEKTADSLFLSNQVGNMYTASLYSCLVAYLTGKPVEELINKPVLFFSYGSGMAASMFSARITQDTQAVRKLLVGIQDVRAKLNERLKVTPAEFTAHLEHRKKTFSLPNRSPTGQPIEASGSADVGQVTVETYLYPGTYYLTSVDGMFRRKYSRFESAPIEDNNNDANCVLSKKSNPVVEQKRPEQSV